MPQICLFNLLELGCEKHFTSMLEEALARWMVLMKDSKWANVDQINRFLGRDELAFPLSSHEFEEWGFQGRIPEFPDNKMLVPIEINLFMQDMDDMKEKLR